MSRGGKRNGAGRKPGSTAPRLSPAPPQIKQELRERAREHTGTALETLVKICTSGESETARVSAASALLDRGYGKPGLQVNLDVTHYDRMDEDQLRAYIEERAQYLQLIENGGTEH